MTNDGLDALRGVSRFRRGLVAGPFKVLPKPEVLRFSKNLNKIKPLCRNIAKFPHRKNQQIRTTHGYQEERKPTVLNIHTRFPTLPTRKQTEKQQKTEVRSHQESGQEARASWAESSRDSS